MKHQATRFRFTILIAACLGCSSNSLDQTLTLATTTSTRDSGLLEKLLPEFEVQTGIKVKVVAVGSGQALELGRRGDADVLLTHAPNAERQFMADGYGLERHSVMFNDFVLVGPRSDPGDVQGEPSIAVAFNRIADAKSLFVSRDDSSGTHMKEQEIWRQSKIKSKGDWYLQSGSGMAEALRLANQKSAYTLSDRATFLAQQSSLKLVILSEGDPLLRNPYAVMVVSPRKHPHVQSQNAKRFAEFLLETSTQALISKFGKEQFGQALFFVNPSRKE